MFIKKATIGKIKRTNSFGVYLQQMKGALSSGGKKKLLTFKQKLENWKKMSEKDKSKYKSILKDK